jgi:uncharacterized membrane protein
MKIEKQRSRISGTVRWSTLIGGSALVYWGVRRGSWLGAAAAVAGSDLVVRGLTGDGHVHHILNVRMPGDRSLPYGRGIKLRRSVTINRPVAELYRFWRNFENLPRFMKHLESVRVLDERRSHWVAKAPAGTKVEWDAEITVERENEIIGWRSLEGADVDNAGSVRFEPARGGRGTVVRVQLQYNALAGEVGAAIAKLFGEEPEQQIAEDLTRFKQLMEVGEIPTTEGQPSGRPEDRERVLAARRRGQVLQRAETVEEASDESFPASDAPAWTTGGGGSGA